MYICSQTKNIAEDAYLGNSCLTELRQDFIQDMNMILALSTHGPM